MVMQSAFFKLANIIPIDDAVKYLKDAVVTSYGSKGEKVVNMNNGAIDHGIESLHRVNVPAEWKDAVDEEVPVNEKTPEFITKVQNVMNRQEGDRRHPGRQQLADDDLLAAQRRGLQQCQGRVGPVTIDGGRRQRGGDDEPDSQHEADDDVVDRQKIVVGRP